MTSLNSLAKETFSMAKSFIVDQPLESLIHTFDQVNVDSKAPAVLLVPGYLERPGCFTALHNTLTEQGFRVFVYRPQNFFCSINQHAQKVQELIKLLTRQYQVKSLTLVGHSMGGLISRTVAQSLWKGPSVLKSVITVGTPNSGTVLSYLGIGRCTAEMVPGSSFLAKLNQGDEKVRNRMVAFVAQDDLLVPDFASAKLPGATSYLIEQVGHLAILEDAQFLRLITQELSSRMKPLRQVAN